MLGEELATLVDEVQDAGSRHLEWSAALLPSGVYFYSIRARSMVNGEIFSATRKMAFVK